LPPTGIQIDSGTTLNHWALLLRELSDAGGIGRSAAYPSLPGEGEGIPSDS
jgi:hypothetical protein